MSSDFDSTLDLFLLLFLVPTGRLDAAAAHSRHSAAKFMSFDRDGSSRTAVANARNKYLPNISRTAVAVVYSPYSFSLCRQMAP